MRGTDLNMIERPDDGCGKRLLGVRRLPRMKLATSSPERQREEILSRPRSWSVTSSAEPTTESFRVQPT